MDTHFCFDGNDFVWNTAKAATNQRKHGVRFEEAATVFGDPLLVVVDASRGGEARDAVIGFDLSGRLLYVVHIEVDAEYIRIISARRATPSEEKTCVER